MVFDSKALGSDNAETAHVAPRAVRAFLLAFLTPCIVAFLIGGFSLAVLYSNLEYVGPREAAEIQHDRGGLYGSALFYRPLPYKLELYSLTNADVAIVGSSRAMPFIQAGFAVPMVNLGGAVNEMVDAGPVFHQMIAAHKPRTIIFVLDFWWFNKERAEAPTEFSAEAKTEFSVADLIAPYEWLSAGTITPTGIVRALFGKQGEAPRIGVWANQNSAGFDGAGAYHYGAMLTGLAVHDDIKFKSTLKRLRKHSRDSKLAVDVAFSDQAWSQLVEVSELLQKAGIDVRFVLPPIAGAVLREIDADSETSLLRILRSRLSSLRQPVYDFTDPATLGANDCEFVDGLHAGFVTYLRILQAMRPDVERAPDMANILQPPEVLARMIAENAGRATLKSEDPLSPEVDFLELGCKK